MYGYIYKRENLINNKIYVGQHKYVRESVELDPRYDGSGKVFQLAVEKYGIDNFTYEIIDSAETPEELNEKEIFWIKELDCRVPKGYNISKGGNGFNLEPEILRMYAKKGNMIRNSVKHYQPESQKQKMREYLKQRGITQHFREACAKAKMGNNYGSANKGTFYITDGVVNIRLHKGDTYDETRFHKGFTFSEEYKKKQKENYVDKIYVHKGSLTKLIKQVELNDYLSQGYELGRDKDIYKTWSDKISKGKRGTIKVVNQEGKVKYIQPEKLEEFEKLGFHR